MRYPPTLQRRLHALTASLAAEGVAWTPAESSHMRVRTDARTSLATQDVVWSLLGDVRRWYDSASRAWTSAFVAETRNLAQSCDRHSSLRRDAAISLMALASRADKEKRRLVEERALILGSIQDESLIPEIGLADDLPDTPGTHNCAPGDWRQAERDLLALLRLQLALETGGLDVQPQQEIAASLRLMRRAVQTWQEAEGKPRAIPLTHEHVLNAVREVEGADEETKKRKAVEVVLDVIAEMARRVARSEELSPYADTDFLQGAMENMGDLVWRMRGVAGMTTALTEIDFAHVLAIWQQSDDPKLQAAAAELDIRLVGWNRDPEAAHMEWRRCQQGAPPEPVGWREGVHHLAGQLADAGILWHPRADTIRHHAGALLPARLARHVAILLARLRAWHFQAASNEETTAFATEMRMQAAAWRDVWRQTDEIDWREGAEECERMAWRAELMGCRLTESWGCLRSSITGHRPTLQPSNALPDLSERADQSMTIEDAYTGLWRLSTALRRGAIRTTEEIPAEAS